MLKLSIVLVILGFVASGCGTLHTSVRPNGSLVPQRVNPPTVFTAGRI